MPRGSRVKQRRPDLSVESRRAIPDSTIVEPHRSLADKDEVKKATARIPIRRDTRLARPARFFLLSSPLFSFAIGLACVYPVRPIKPDPRQGG